jgi:hypothetical protein
MPSRVTDRIAFLRVDLLADEGGDELVPAHAHCPVDAPDRQNDSVPKKRAVPRERVLVVGVDERAVDVEQRGLGH